MTLAELAQAARGWGYECLELWTGGDGSRGLASDPSLIASEKVRRTLLGVGVEVAGLATDERFDEPIFPPIIGRALMSTPAAVVRARRAVGLAVALEAPIVRVFGFQGQEGESVRGVSRRIAERLRMVGDHAVKSGVRVCVQNAGWFSRGEDLAELLDRVGHPQVRATFSAMTSALAGEDPVLGMRALGTGLEQLRLADFRGDPKDPERVLIGDGTVDCRALVHECTRTHPEDSVVIDWNRMVFPDLADAGHILPESADRFWKWIGEARSNPDRIRQGADRAPV